MSEIMAGYMPASIESQQSIAMRIPGLEAQRDYFAALAFGHFVDLVKSAPSDSIDGEKPVEVAVFASELDDVRYIKNGELQDSRREKFIKRVQSLNADLVSPLDQTVNLDTATAAADTLISRRALQRARAIAHFGPRVLVETTVYMKDNQTPLGHSYVIHSDAVLKDTVSERELQLVS
jgi:hypothetical protein